MQDTAVERAVLATAVVLAATGASAWLALATPTPTASPAPPLAIEPRGGGEPNGAPTGVVASDVRAWAGLNLVASGRTEATLLDMEGREVHRWTAPWPEATRSSVAWRKVRLLPDGGLVALVDGVGVLCLDRASAVRWHRANRAHHALAVRPDGQVEVLTRQMRNLEEVSHLDGIADDTIAILAPDGRPARKTSVFDAWRASGDVTWKREAAKGGNLLGINGFEAIGAGLQPPFLEGHILLSVRKLDRLAVLDPDRGRITWSVGGPWQSPSDPHALPDGGLLLFAAHRALEIDPVSGEVRWQSPPVGDAGDSEGTAQRLPNGNTLVVVHETGRAVEWTRGGERVWEYVNPEASAEDPDRPAWLDVERLAGAAWHAP